MKLKNVVYVAITFSGRGADGLDHECMFLTNVEVPADGIRYQLGTTEVSATKIHLDDENIHVIAEDN